MAREFCARCNAIKKLGHICGDVARTNWKKVQEARKEKK